jgi:hypothetical protein
MFSDAGGVTEDRIDGLENDAVGVGSSSEDIVESEHYLALMGLQVLDL